MITHIEASSRLRKKQRLLCLDTTSKTLHLGFFESGETASLQTLFQIEEENSSYRYHSAILPPAIKSGLQETGWKPATITGLGVNTGPGSFTGIRTGISTVRVLAQFLNIPIYAFNTFELLASIYSGETCEIYWDALQGKAYFARLVYQPETDSPFFYEIPPCLIHLSEQQLASSAMHRIASEKLLSGHFSFLEGATSIESHPLQMPLSMAEMIIRHDSALRRPWREVLPFYLQEPNITLRKQQAGRLK